MWRAYTGVIHYAFDQIPNLQKLLYHTKQKLREEGASDHLPPGPFTGHFLRKADI
jgi:hypothetical protein